MTVLFYHNHCESSTWALSWNHLEAHAYDFKMKYICAPQYARDPRETLFAHIVEPIFKRSNRWILSMSVLEDNRDRRVTKAFLIFVKRFEAFFSIPWHAFLPFKSKVSQCFKRCETINLYSPFFSVSVSLVIKKWSIKTLQNGDKRFNLPRYTLKKTDRPL